MPYCVRCGVELQNHIKACPLCQTEVILPGEQETHEGVAAFPDRMPRGRRSTLNLAPSRAFLLLATFILLVPLLVTFFIDITVNQKITWSFYPMASLALLWILIAYPALLKRPTLLQVLTTDLFAIMVFLVSMDLYLGPFPEWSQFPVLSLLLVWFFMAAPLIFTWKYPVLILVMWFTGGACFLYALDQATGEAQWFLTLAFPILCVVTLIGSLGMILFKRLAAKPLLTAGFFLGMITLALSAIDGIVNLYAAQRFMLTWSPILSAVFIPSAAFLFLVHKNPEFKAYLSKKFHV